MQSTELAGIVAASVNLIGYYLYVRDIFVKPDKEKSLTAWIIWTLVGFLLWRSYLLVGAGRTDHSAWIFLVYTVMPPVVLVSILLKFRRWHAPFTPHDWAFLVCSALSGLYLWHYREGLLPLHVNMAVDVAGAYLVSKNALREPEAENVWAWVWFSLANVVNLLAVQVWSYPTVVYPLVVLGMCLSTLTCSLVGHSRR